MSDHRPDRDPELEAAFQALRTDDRAHTPDAAAILARARIQVGDETDGGIDTAPQAAARRRSWLRWGVPGMSVALAAAAAALLLLDAGSDGADDEFDRAVQGWVEARADWRAPTDGLLRLPGDEILRTVPRVGGGRPAPRDPDVPPPDGPGRESPS